MQTENNQNDTDVENQIAQFKEQLGQKSNQELSQVVNQLESVEKAALKQKISNQLDSIQESLTQPNENQASTATQDKNSSGSTGEDQNSENNKKDNSTDNQEQGAK